MAHLVRRPQWLVGQALGVLTLAFHALALNSGPITLVQPLVISGIVIAVPLRAAISRSLPAAREMAGVLVAAAGLALFLVVAAPSVGSGTGLSGTALVLVLIALAAGSAVLLLGQRLTTGRHRAFLLGAAGGIFFALVAVTLKLTLAELPADGVLGVVVGWPLYACGAAGLGGVVCNQLAYRSARLSSSMPVLNAVDCLVAIGFGFVVFHEVPRHSAAALGLEGVALLALVSGLWLLARVESPVSPGSPVGEGDVVDRLVR